MSEENSIEFWRNKCAELESRIKASEDQEPAFVIHDELGNTHNLYKQPLMPEVEELVGWCPVCNTVRMSLPKPAEGSCSHCFNHLMKLASAYDLQELQRENAELARKLAEQHRTNESLTDMLEDARTELQCIRAALGIEYEPHQTLFDRTLDACRSVAEPTKLIEEAKRQAVPEGWKLVQCNEFEIRVESPDKSAWRFRNVDNGTSDQFIYELLSAMLSVAPQPERKD